MTPILGAPPDTLRQPLEGVLEKALARAGTPPPWLVVEDEAGVWVRAAAAFPAAERARAVAAVASDRGLRVALRLGLGGAVWLPPSTPAMAVALAAAAEPCETATCDPQLVDLLFDLGEPLLAVAPARPGFWRAELGTGLGCVLLAALARELSALPALLPWPALLLAGQSRPAIAAAWERVCGRVEWAAELELDPVEVADPSRAAELLAAAAAGEAAPAPRAVVELPGGATVGRWALGAPLAGAVRVPVWASRRPRPGSPSGLLLERQAAACERSGVPLWVPLVDRAMLPFLRRLPGRLWLDGPAVPTPC